MHLVRTSLILLFLLPLAAEGQRRRQPPPQRTGGRVTRPESPELRGKDLESLNPAMIALTLGKDLALKGDQVNRLDSVARTFGKEAKDFGRDIDTLQNIMQKARSNLMKMNERRGPRDRPASPKDSIERVRSDSVDQAKADREEERYMAAKRAFSGTLLKIRETYDARLAEVNGLLDDDQRRTMAPWFRSASEELTARLRWANAR